MTIIPLLLLLPLVISHPLQHARSATCPVVLQDDLDARISGGDVSKRNAHTYMVSVTSHIFSCSGSLLSTRWVLTAAHCHVRPDWEVRIGTANALQGVATRIAHVHTHERYSDTLAGFDVDIALVQLAEDAPPWASFVLVNTNPHLPLLGSFTRAIGFGKRFEDEDEPDFVLRQVDVPTVQWNRCWLSYQSLGVDVKPRLHVCSGYNDGGCSFCKGDSGGPIVQYDADGNAVQLGIISFQDGCAQAHVSAVSLRLATFVDWMIDKGAQFAITNSTLAVYTQDSVSVTTEIGESSSTTTGPLDIAFAPPNEPAQTHVQPGGTAGGSGRMLRIALVTGVAVVALLAVSATLLVIVIVVKRRASERRRGSDGSYDDDGMMEISDEFELSEDGRVGEQHMEDAVETSGDDASDFSSSSQL